MSLPQKNLRLVFSEFRYGLGIMSCLKVICGNFPAITACSSDCSRLFASVFQVLLELFSSYSVTSMSVSEVKTSQGIPSAEFIEDVDAYMNKRADKETPEEVVSVRIRSPKC